MTSFVRKSGVWREAKYIYTRIGGISQKLIEGWAKVDGVWKQIYEVPQVPSAPTAVAVSNITSTSCSLSWTAPTDDGGEPITSYEVYFSTSLEGNYTLKTTATASPASITGLSNGTAYYFKVRAINVNGNGDFSEPVGMTTLVGAPGTVTFTLAAGSPADTRFNVTASVSGGGTPDFWDVEYRENGTTGGWQTQSFTATTVPQTVTLVGLLSNYAYEVRVKARNATGSSSYANSKYRVTAVLTNSQTGGMSTTANPCIPSQIGYGLNSPSVGGCGVPFGGGHTFIRARQVERLVTFSGNQIALLLLGNGLQYYWNRCTVYTAVDAADSRTFSAGEAVFLSFPGQYDSWGYGGSDAPYFIEGASYTMTISW